MSSKSVRASWIAVCLGVGGVGAGCAADASPSEAAAPIEATAHKQQAWDSASGNPTHATHSYLTEYAVDALSPQYPDLPNYRSVLVDGANQELHELPVSDPFSEQLRVEAGGTNWAASHPEVVWKRALASATAGDQWTAYWYVGIILHYVEDMGVPAHAFHVIHQGSLGQADDFEILGLQRWAPLFDALHVDPHLPAPSDYVAWSGAWTQQDFKQTFPGVTYTTSFFPVSWFWASSTKARFVREREGRSAMATKYALEVAINALNAVTPR
jgi:hypothetical protein